MSNNGKAKIVRDYIYLKITSGEWSAGSKISSENMLAIKFNVSRLTAREAIKQFVISGILESHKGKGYFVSMDDYIPFKSFKKRLNADRTKTNLIEVDLHKYKTSFYNMEENEINYHSFQKEYLREDKLVGYQVTFINSNSIFDIDLGKINDSLMKFLAYYGKKMKTYKSTALFGSIDILDDAARIMGWKDEYPYTITITHDAESWLEFSYKVFSKDSFRHVSTYQSVL